MPTRNLEELANASAKAHLSNVTAEILRPGRPAYDAEVIFDREYAESELVAGYNPIISGLTSQLDPNGGVCENTQVRLEGDLYRLANRQPDGTGWETWRLERDENL